MTRDEMIETLAEIERNADHARYCGGWRGPENEEWFEGPCDCWKSKVVALIDAALRAPAAGAPPAPAPSMPEPSPARAGYPYTEAGDAVMAQRFPAQPGCVSCDSRYAADAVLSLPDQWRQDAVKVQARYGMWQAQRMIDCATQLERALEQSAPPVVAGGDALEEGPRCTCPVRPCGACDYDPPRQLRSVNDGPYLKGQAPRRRRQEGQ